MSCLHQRAGTTTGRFAMLLSTNGVGCVECRSRLHVPMRVRLGLLGVFLVGVALAPFSASATAVPMVVLGLIGLPWLQRCELDVVRTPEG